MFQDSAYYKQVQEKFGSFASHPIIAALDLNNDEDIQRFYSFRENAYGFAFNGDRLVRSGPYAELFGTDRDNEFHRRLRLVEDFAKVSGFRAFYQKNNAYYRQLISDFQSVAPLTNMVAWLEKAFGPGYRYDSYKVIFSPLIGYSHSAQRGEAEGFRESLMFVGAPHIFGKGEFAEAEIARMIFTEIDHNFVNPVSDTHRGAIDQAMTKLCFWNEPENSGGYRTAYDTFNEYMTWALFSLWADQRYRDRQTFFRIRKLNRQDMWERGFPQFTYFDRALGRAYGADKRLIPTIYPEVISAAKKLESERAASVTCAPR